MDMNRRYPDQHHHPPQEIGIIDNHRRKEGNLGSRLYKLWVMQS